MGALATEEVHALAEELQALFPEYKLSTAERNAIAWLMDVANASGEPMSPNAARRIIFAVKQGGLKTLQLEAIMTLPTYYIDDAAVTARQAEHDNPTQFVGGCNASASNGCGIGINMDQGAVLGTPEAWTLLDQNGAARTPQNSSIVGDTGSNEIKRALGNQTGDGVVTQSGTANLVTLEAGWVPSAV